MKVYCKIFEIIKILFYLLGWINKPPVNDEKNLTNLKVKHLLHQWMSFQILSKDCIQIIVEYLHLNSRPLGHYWTIGLCISMQQRILIMYAGYGDICYEIEIKTFDSVFMRLAMWIMYNVHVVIYQLI